MTPRFDDYYEWGHNCKILGYAREEAARHLEQVKFRTTRDEELFWEGYSAMPMRSHLVEINLVYDVAA